MVFKNIIMKIPVRIKNTETIFNKQTVTCKIIFLNNTLKKRQLQRLKTIPNQQF